MCGRAKLPTDYSEIKIQLGLDDFTPPNLAPSWNIAPTQDMLCVLYDAEHKRRIARQSG